MYRILIGWLYDENAYLSVKFSLPIREKTLPIREKWCCNTLMMSVLDACS